MTAPSDNHGRTLRGIMWAVLLSCIIPPGTPAQQATTASGPLQRQRIEQAWNLMRDTTGEYVLNDMKETWIIHDKNVIREILLSLLNKNIVFTHSPASVPFNSLKSVIEDILETNRTIVIAQKRFGESKLENIKLKSDSYEYNIADYIYLRELLGKTYDKVLAKEYSYSDYTKVKSPEADMGSAANFDLYVSTLTPELMLLSTSPMNEGRWYISTFGNFGVDAINLPLWARGTATVGLRAKHRGIFLEKGRDYDLLSIHVGWEEPTNFSIPTGTALSNTFKQPKLVGSSSSIFLKALYNPNWNLPGGQYDEWGLEASISVIPKGPREFSRWLPVDFYTIRNYLTLSTKANQIWSLVDAGVGITWHDLDYISRISATNSVRELQPTKYNYVPYFEGGISQNWELLQFALSGRINYNLNEKFGFMAWNARVTITNSFGIDFRYHRAFPGSLPVWQSRDYMVISPIIHITY